MAVKHVEFIPENWGGENNRLFQRKYTLTYRVTTDDPFDGPVVCFSAKDPITGLSIPRVGTPYGLSGKEFDLGSFVETIAPRLESRAVDTGGYSWLVSINYGPYDAGTFPDNPLDWPAIAWVEGQKYEKVVTEDVNGNPIRNSAKMPFAEPPTIDDSRCILYVKRNVPCATYNYALASLFKDKLNDATWNTFAAKTVKCNSIETGEPQFDSTNQIRYYAELNTFEINADGWQKIFLDQGFDHLDTSTPPQPRKNLDKDGQPVTEEKLLDGSGQILLSGTPVFLPFDVYFTKDFSKLNIDLSKALGR